MKLIPAKKVSALCRNEAVKIRQFKFGEPDGCGELFGKWEFEKGCQFTCELL